MLSSSYFTIKVYTKIMKNKSRITQGFTLVELLIVIAVISILAAVAFVAIDPATRINEAQDSERWSSANAVLDAFLQYTVDNDGEYLAGVSADGTTHMVATSSGACSACSVDQCTNFSTLATDGYIASLPNDPDGTAAWDGGFGGTGYTLTVAANGIITVASCGAEEDIITVAR